MSSANNLLPLATLLVVCADMTGEGAADTDKADTDVSCEVSRLTAENMVADFCSSSGKLLSSISVYTTGASPDSPAGVKGLLGSGWDPFIMGGHWSGGLATESG